MPPDPNDALLQQMAQAGLYPQQIAALKPLLGMGQQFMDPQTAQGRQVGQTYVAASPLEHLSNAIRQATGAYMTGKALGKERDITQQLGGTRQKYLQALQAAGQTTPYTAPQAPPDLLKAPDYDQQQAQAKGQFEAQQQAQAQQRLGPLLMGGAASGDPAMQGAAHFGQQEQNFARQGAVLQESIRQHEAENALRKEQIEQSRFTPIKDMFGNPTALLEGKTGKVLPLSVGKGAGGLTPEAVKMLTQQGLTTGQVPQIGRGAAGTATSMQIANSMAAGGGTTPDLAGAKAGYHADTGSLATQQKLLDLTKSWEATGKANLGVLKSATQDMVNVGSPLLNKPLRWLFQNAAGDPNVVKFKAAHAAVVNEYAKILSGSMGSAGVTEGARHEAESMLPLDSTPSQVAAVADVLETDAGNRLGAITKQVQETRARAGGQAPAASTPPAAAPSTIDAAALRKKYGL